MGQDKRHATSPLLLTPGPLTTALRTSYAMLRDWGSRDQAFIALTARVRRRLSALIDSSGAFTCVPIQGSGTFALEAMITSLVPPAGRVLVAVNGAYGRRMARIADVSGRVPVVIEAPEDRPFPAAAIAAALAEDGAIGHVAAVHCETTTGVRNPLADIAASVRDHGRRLLVDAMSSLGALPVDAQSLPCDAVAASANKCLEGVPGVAFVIVRREVIAASAGFAPSLSLDLHDQWQGFEGNGQWRFTPPTHIVAALDSALSALDEEGGIAARGRRYAENCRVLVDGMRALGFRPLLAPADQAPIIVTFHAPPDANYDFQRFYAALLERGYAIYPGKLANADSFRIGCIGALGREHLEGAVRAVGAVADAQEITVRAPR